MPRQWKGASAIGNYTRFVGRRRKHLRTPLISTPLIAANNKSSKMLRYARRPAQGLMLIDSANEGKSCYLRTGVPSNSGSTSAIIRGAERGAGHQLGD